MVLCKCILNYTYRTPLYVEDIARGTDIMSTQQNHDTTDIALLLIYSFKYLLSLCQTVVYAKDNKYSLIFVLVNFVH